MKESTSGLIELVADAVVFFSPADEAAFFDWSRKVASLKKCEGRGPAIIFTIDTSKTLEADLRELIGLFFRYRIPMGQLRVFDLDRFAHWFRDKNSYWYEQVFLS